MALGGATAPDHYGHEQFEHLDFAPCGCGCGQWVEWLGNDEDTWTPAPQYMYNVRDVDTSTKEEEIIAVITRFDPPTKNQGTDMEGRMPY